MRNLVRGFRGLDGRMLVEQGFPSRIGPEINVHEQMAFTAAAFAELFPVIGLGGFSSNSALNVLPGVFASLG